MPTVPPRVRLSHSWEERMVAHRIFLFALLLLLTPAAWPQSGKTAAPYYPDAVWQHRTPSEAGVDPQRLRDAIAFAISAETKAPRDLKLNHYQTFGREPFGYAIG